MVCADANRQTSAKVDETTKIFLKNAQLYEMRDCSSERARTEKHFKAASSSSSWQIQWPYEKKNDMSAATTTGLSVTCARVWGDRKQSEVK